MPTISEEDLSFAARDSEELFNQVLHSHTKSITAVCAVCMCLISVASASLKDQSDMSAHRQQVMELLNQLWDFHDQYQGIENGEVH